MAIRSSERDGTRNRKHGSLLTALVLGVSACATAGTQTADLAPAQSQHVSNEVTVTGSSDVVWDQLVAQLSRSFYVINNIDKASRLLNVSFYSDSPADYIDCGTTTRTYTRGDENQTYRYAFAASSSYKLGQRRDNAIITYNVNRSTKLEGRANIYVAPKDAGSTAVMVNARYILTVNVTGIYQAESLIGIKGATGPMDPSTYTVSFNTNQANTTNVATAGDPPSYVTCYSRGKLEGDIIKFAQHN
jgi:hypothetical protein